MKPSINRWPDRIVPGWRRTLQRVAWLEPFWVALIGGLLLLPPRFLPEAVQPDLTLYRPALTMLLVLFWPIRWLAYRQLTRRTPLDLPLWLLLLWLPVNYWASADKALSWEAISYLLFGVTAYLALINWPPAQQRPHLIGWTILMLGIGLTLAAPLLSQLALSKLFHLPALDELLQRLHGLVPGEVNVNRIAGTLVLTIPLPVALALRRDWSRRRWLSIGCGLLAVLMSGALILTQSRSAYLATTVAIALIFALRWPKLWYAIPILIVIGVIVTIQIGPRAVLDEVSSGGALNGLEGRLELWSRAIYAISDFPFTGIGVGTFERVIPLLYPLFTIGPDVTITHAHNLLLQVGVDLGLPGLIAYLALFVNVFALIAMTLRRRTAALNWALAAGAAGGLVAMFVHGIFDAAVWGSKPAFLPWLLIALVVQVGLQTALPPLD